MKLKTIPFTQAELLTSFQQTNREVADFFAAIPAERFFTHPDGVWSPAENLVHLLKAVSPVARAMKLPKFVLALLFGRGKQSSRTLEQIQTTDLEKLAQGARASGGFVPQIDGNPSDPRQVQQGLIQKWNEVSARVPAVLATWNDSVLDQRSLPHPILGKLTVREMLFFTLYHNTHHVSDVERLLAENKLPEKID